MFASSFLQPNKHYIRGPGDKEIPLQSMNRCGIMVYAFTAVVFLVTVICSMTLPAFQLEEITMSPELIDGQNCTILGAYSGDINLNPSLSGDDIDILSTCVFDPNLKSNSITPTGSPVECPLAAAYATGPEISDTYFSSQCDTTQASNKALVNQLVGIFQGFKCASVYNDGFSDYPNSLYSSPRAQGMYFSSYENCLSSVKLNSVKINRFPITAKAEMSNGGITFPTSIFPADCNIAVKAASLEYDFSPSSPAMIKVGIGAQGKNKTPLKGDYYTNLVGSKGSDSNGNMVCDKCGIPITEACPNFDGAQMAKFFNLLYPTFASDVCFNFKSLPPYQCIKKSPPTFVSALGNSLAIMNTLLGVLFAVAVYMLQNGYNVFDNGSGSGTSSNNTSGKTEDADATEIEMSVDVKPKTGADAMVENPLSKMSNL